MNNSTITLEKLQQSPSFKCGYSPKYERNIRVFACNMIESAAVLLKLPQVAAATAQVLLHRFYFMVSISEFPLFDVIGACLYLSSKLEECPRRLRELLSVLDYLRKKAEKLPLTKLDITKALYFDYREGLLKAEIEILAQLAFNVHVELPHGFMLNYLSSLELSDHPELPQIALNYLHDSLRTISCVLYQPPAIATAVIFLAARDCKVALPENPPWYGVFDADYEDIELICTLILELYELKDGIVGFPETIKPDLAKPLVT
ncbi:cyclin [Globomyces pollinis-pini]|nr:cyclin [Globomyces pollinis-pini]